MLTNLPSNAGDMGSIPGSRRSPEEGNGNPFQFSCMGNPKNKGDWRSIAHGVAKERDIKQQLNNNKNHWQDFFLSFGSIKFLVLLHNSCPACFFHQCFDFKCDTYYCTGAFFL